MIQILTKKKNIYRIQILPISKFLVKNYSPKLHVEILSIKRKVACRNKTNICNQNFLSIISQYLHFLGKYVNVSYLNIIQFKCYVFKYPFKYSEYFKQTKKR
jgi:hypothetical protein